MNQRMSRFGPITNLGVLFSYQTFIEQIFLYIDAIFYRERVSQRANFNVSSKIRRKNVFPNQLLLQLFVKNCLKSLKMNIFVRENFVTAESLRRQKILHLTALCNPGNGTFQKEIEIFIWC